MSQELRAVIWNAVSSKAQAEKESLPETEKLLRTIADQNGWRVVDVLTVPGHTRSYVDFYDMAEDALNAHPPIDAFFRLRDHWQRRDFDVLLARDGDRFARDPAPIALIFGKVLESGARIFTLQDKWIDQQSRLLSTMMIGYRAAAEVSNMKTRQKIAKDARARKGIPVGAHTPYGFLKLRDHLGRLQGITHDPEARLVLDDVAALILERVSWLYIEAALFERFGHVNHRNGQRFKPYFFYHVLYSPWTWGNGARRYKSADIANGQKIGLWTVEPGHPIPEGALIEYNTHDALYSGELAQRLKAELRRRYRLLGGTTASTSHRFTGLVLCGYCGYYMQHSTSRSNLATFRCQSARFARLRPGCDTYRQVHESELQRWLGGLIQMALDQDDYSVLHPQDNPNELISHADALGDELVHLNAQVDTLIYKQATAPPNLAERYDAALEQLSQRIDSISRRLADVRAQQARDDEREARQAFAAIQRYTSIDAFWQADASAVNALLHRLLGKRRLVVKDGLVVGFADAPPRPQLKHGGRKKRKPTHHRAE